MNINQERYKQLTPKQWARLSDMHSRGTKASVWDADGTVKQCAEAMSMTTKELRKLVAGGLQEWNEAGEVVL